MHVYIEDIGKHEGQDVTIKGWLSNRRSSGKIHFLILRDGSGFIQGVMSKATVGEEMFKAADHLSQETSVIVTGTVRADKRAPSGYEIDPALAGATGKDCLRTFNHPLDACAGAHLVTTDVWTSMGYETESEARMKAFIDWCVDADMMAAAQPDALFMHCLPAHRGEEVQPEVIDGPQSVVWDEAENRMHVQKALMEYLLLGRV